MTDEQIAQLAKRPDLVLELGCGRRKRFPDAIGIDLVQGPGVDLVGDAREILREFPSRSVSHVYSSHFLEHVPDLPGILREIGRVLKPGGMATCVVPHFSNPHYYSDYTHRMFFGLYTMSYLCESDLFWRKVPQYDTINELRLRSVRLRFRAARPFFLQDAIRRVIFTPIVNICAYTQEAYEAFLSRLFSCHEIEFVLERKITP